MVVTPFDRAVAALDSRTNYESSGRLPAPTLERIEALLDTMAHPERSYPVVHVTGTVGKTTTVKAAAEVLRAAGLSVGTYISPHVESLRERFSFDGALISEDEFVEAWDELSSYLDLIDSKSERPVTWFEAATALAFSWFAEKAVDVAVVEVGMGGTWDATNVVDATVAVVTPVALDHTSVLGETVEAIAREKAGIIKEGSILYTASQRQDVADVLRARCETVGAQLRAEGLAFELERSAPAMGGQQLSLRLGHDRYPVVYLPMFGEQFAHDALLGAAAARALLGEATLGEDVLGEAFSNIVVPGRLEVVRRHPLVVLDGAHNPPAADALADAIRASFPWERLVLVISVMDDKDVEGVLAPLVPVAAQIIATRNHSPRAASPERIADAVRALGGDAVIVKDVADAISFAIERSGERDCILVTGSLYTVGDARPMFAAQR